MSQPVPDHRRRGRRRVSRLALAGALTAGALAVVPAAQANSLVSARAHIHAADTALHHVVSGVTGGAVSGPLAELQAQLAAAGKDAAKLYKHAHTKTIRVEAAAAISKLAAQENRDAQILTPLVGQVTGSNQADLAAFIAAVTQGREQSLSLVSTLLAQLPASVQSQVAGLVAQLSTAGTGQVGQLAGAISPGSVACPAIDAVSQVVATVLTSVQADLARVQSILSFLPVGAQTQLLDTVNGLPAQLTSLVATVKQAFGCSSTTPMTTGVTGLAGDPTAVVNTVIGSVTQLVSSLLASFLPSVGLGQTPATVGVTGPVSGLLGQVTSLVPGIGSLFGGSGSGLLGGILGSIPGLSGLGI